MRLLAFALAALLLPIAAAGSARDPEIHDAPDVTDKAADILSAWFEAEDAGLRFSIRTVEGGVRDHTYWVRFVLRETGEELSATLGYGPDTRLRSHLGPLTGPNYDRGGFERVANDGLILTRETRGSPHTWSGVIPWDATFGLKMGATLDALTVGTAVYDRDASRWRGGIDSARAPEPYIIAAKTSFLPILVPAWVIPTIVVGFTTVGLAGGVALAIKTKPRVKEPAAAPDEPLREARAPGERFQRAPPAPRR